VLAELERSGGRGINNLRERARAIGAEVDWLGSRFSSGTRFELRLSVAGLLDSQSASKEG
jgi:signal transduction histidine kinase